MGETLRRVANGPKMSNFYRTLCLKWALTLKGSIFWLWHRKAKWLRIKFYPRKHPSHVQIAHRELSGGSQRAHFSTNSICQKKKFCAAFCLEFKTFQFLS